MVHLHLVGPPLDHSFVGLRQSSKMGVFVPFLVCKILSVIVWNVPGQSGLGESPPIWRPFRAHPISILAGVAAYGARWRKLPLPCLKSGIFCSDLGNQIFFWQSY